MFLNKYFHFFSKSAKYFVFHLLSKQALIFFKHISSQTLLDRDPSTNWTATPVTDLESQYSSGEFDTSFVWAKK